jgi:CBS domain-containing protein
MSKTKKTTLVSDVMSDVVEVLQAGDSLDLAERLMRAGRIRHLPVVDDEQHLVGLVTHRKILAAWVGHGHPLRENHRDVAREIPIDMLMDKDVVTIWPDAPAAEAARLIETNKIGCLPVVGEDGTLVGIVTEADFVRLAREHLERHTA